MIRGIVIAVLSGGFFILATGNPLLGAGLGVAFGAFFGWAKKFEGKGAGQTDGSGSGGDGGIIYDGGSDSDSGGGDGGGGGE